ncbi:SDR family NAD(P)-dependent oxidoreductase [Bosea sp. (in: a-proteobacteria)]|uniref:SDR family NAD(P)-dependent oxidoreductase n=1 Tax=Bosea sp. (in: a-proteobacteria) TaxID=1871050 RepID=UPI0026078893|nr:SDR family NAD(P)-dependent oxidoreductase [Bosea sp. (in: a-proteobacteria)]MCO5090039.1 SDR family NAD(P)-dependent oxidoreductase [Bosea sp. (in: a-proteobacteria)]
MGRLEGKVAFVTGAAGGIGRAICERFVQEGGRVAASDVNSAAVSEWVAANANGHAISIHCDVGDPDSVKKAVGEATRAFGKLNVLCNVAGGSGRSDGTIVQGGEKTIQ